MGLVFDIRSVANCFDHYTAHQIAHFGGFVGQMTVFLEQVGAIVFECICLEEGVEGGVEQHFRVHCAARTSSGIRIIV